MSLTVQQLDLLQWRNFDEKQLSFSDKLTILCGNNAVGKTNTVEALQLLTTGASFRHPKTRELVRDGADIARVDLVLAGDERKIDLTLKIAGNTRTFLKNNKKVQAQDLSDTKMSILFCPDDLALIKRSASYRREELDSFAAQANRTFSSMYSEYMRSVSQRNQLLKQYPPNLDLLSAWDISLSLGAASLFLARLRLFRRLRSYMEEIYKEISGGEELSARYESSLGIDVETHDYTREELTNLYLKAFSELREKELQRQQTLVGPHRDDVLFLINGKDSRAYASQGQQRSLALSWKIAELKLAFELKGDQPLLLLDDVMSELDESRRFAMTDFIEQGIQTIITTTNLGYFPDVLLKKADVIRMG